MGLVLFGLSVGSMIGILCSGRFVSRFGTRPVIAFDTLLIIAGTAVIGVGSAVQSASLVTAGLCLFGAGEARRGQRGRRRRGTHHRDRERQP
ncbi:hypothetical protein [Streptomyces canus]|uniref:hypothetical protein n=1 Tax=Streptomyces canus TaxID=58343 RepID=UPI0038291D57